MDPRALWSNFQHGKEIVLLTGGGGYFGYSLGCALAKSGASVILYDIQKPPSEVPNGAAFIQADVRNYDALFAACEGADCVFHIASYGMSGLEQLQRKQIESINIGGTKFIIDVCKQRNIPRLVYTSTINVVFGGNHIEEGDEETVPYFPLEKHIDHYSKTKSIADQMVLAANASLLSGGDKLRTCVLRPPGIYGPQEQRHLPRIARNIERGFFRFRFGEPTAQMNWVHVENLVQAHILAAEALTSEKNYIASGQAYYINDGENVNLFEWITPLVCKIHMFISNATYLEKTVCSHLKIINSIIHAQTRKLYLYNYLHIYNSNLGVHIEIFTC
uniref:Putative short-chain dehydrogenase/reductase family 42E member 2 n=1 Tax=Crocodylus porosus TaxID=8502 RepID=A0A7M4EDK7_CROPO